MDIKPISSGIHVSVGEKKKMTPATSTNFSFFSLVETYLKYETYNGKL